MIDNFNDLWTILFGTAIIFAVMLFIFRKHVFHLLDPLLYYLIIQSFSIELAFITIEDTHYLINFLFCQVFFMAGFFCFAGKPLQKTDFQSTKFFEKTNINHLSVLKWYAIFAAFVLIAGNILLMHSKGIALFADDPSDAKVSNFSNGGGWGVIKRMNSGMLYFVGLSLIFLFLFKKRYRYISICLLLLVINALSGSKGALLYFIFLISFYKCFVDIKSNPVVKEIKIGSYILLIIAVLLAGIIVSATSEDNSAQNKVFGLATRFLFYGDAEIYYYDHSSIQHFANYNVFNFFSDEFNSILGLFRLVPYRQPVGFRLIDYYFNIDSETFGPNVPYYVKGNIYFGYYGALIFSFYTGAVIGFVRKFFYLLVRNGTTSIIYGLLIIHLNLIIFSFAQDSQLFISNLFDTFTLSVPVAAFAGCLYIYNRRQQKLFFKTG
jgi:oligosaccharide repeat unit polymerase